MLARWKHDHGSTGGSRVSISSPHQIKPQPVDGPTDQHHAAEIIYWAAKKFRGRLAVTSSLQTQSVPLLHLISRICPNVPVLFLDTGFHFSETLSFKDHLRRKLGLNVIELRPLMGHQQFRARHADLHVSNPNMCCYLNKVEPLQRKLRKYSAWISGIRRDQTEHRSQTPVMELKDNGLFKICPMVMWQDRDVANYIDRHQLTRHPLHDAGYQSIGCACCTKAVSLGEDPRSGRWAGQEKTECGLHDLMAKQKREEQQD